MTKTEASLATFDFSGLELRVLMHEGEPWFVAADVLTALGMNAKSGSSRQYLKALGPDQPRLFKRSSVDPLHLNFPNRGATAISESGLYLLTLRSDKPSAKPLQNWVTRDVLPAIRKTGGYLLNEEARDTAKADDRQAMPLPEVFAQAMQKITYPNAVPAALILSMAFSAHQSGCILPAMESLSKYHMSVRDDGRWNVINRETGGPAEVEIDGAFRLLFGLPKEEAEAWSKLLNENPEINWGENPSR